MSETTWSGGGVTATVAIAHWPQFGPVLRIPGRGAALGPEHARSLAWWLLALVGDRPGPCDPDAVRVAIDEARAALRARSAAVETTEDFRAGLAWCDHALDAIAAAAGAPTPERTTR